MASRSVVPDTFAALFVALTLLSTVPHMADAQASEDFVSEIGPEHDVLLGLRGSWVVRVGGEEVGTASARTRLGDRFLELEITADRGPIRHAIYTFGYDQRNGWYTIHAIDQSGTYAVTAHGTRDGATIAMYGTDDDPTFREMELEKAFAFVLDLSGDGFGLEIRFIDTRSEERREIPFHAFRFERAM